MGDEPTTTLTVAKLKALCVLNDVSASGKKAELLTRLLEAGVDRETLGIEVFDESTATFQPASEEGGDGKDAVVDAEPAKEEDQPVMLSLEDDDTISAVPLPARTSKAPDDEVLDAVVLEADLVDVVDEADRADTNAVPLPKTSGASTPLRCRSPRTT